MAVDLKEVLNRRNTALAKCREIGKRVQDNGAWTAEDSAEFDKWKTEATNAKVEYETLSAQRSNLQWLDDEEQTSLNPFQRQTGNSSSSGTTNKKKRLVWQSRGGHTRRVSLNGRRSSQEYRDDFQHYLTTREMRPNNALRADDEAQGGYLIASEQFAAGLLKNIDDRTYIAGLAKTQVVRESRSLGIRKRTAKMNTVTKGSELGDITSSFDNSLRFGKRVLTPYDYVGGCQVSRDWLRMATESPESIVTNELALNYSEFFEQEFLYGDGQEGALGVMVADNEGIPTSRDVSPVNGDWTDTETPAPTTGYTFSSLMRMKYSLKAQYRSTARWMFHRDHVSYMNRIRDLNGNYIFEPSKVVGEPDRLLGLPFDESEWMPNTFSTGTYAGILANWNQYMIVYGLDMELQRLNELAARTNQVEFHLRAKMDANVLLEEAFARLKFA